MIIGIVSELRHVFGLDTECGDFTGLECGQLGGVIGENAVFNVFEIIRAGIGAFVGSETPVVIFVTGEDDFLVADPFNQFVRANRSDCVPTVVIAGFFHSALAVWSQIIAVGEGVEDGEIGLIQSDHQGVVISGFPTGNSAQLIGGHRRDEVISRGAVKGVYPVLGGERITIVELDIIAQMECVGLPVFADIPALSQVGNVVAFHVFGQQCAANPAHDAAGDGEAGFLDVQGVRLFL